MFIIRENNPSSFLLDGDGFSRLFLLKKFDFHSEPGEFFSFCAEHSQFGSSREKNVVFLPR